MKNINVTINGRTLSIAVDEKWTLLHLLREELTLTGTKYGCGTSDCGACKVLVDGEALNSCVLLARNMDGKNITTIEGLSAGGGLHPVQQAFIDAGAIQCGFCTPGMVITAVALLDKNPSPTREEIIDALDNNLCRCTGYEKIIEAIELASSRLSDKEGR
ncbi:MAG: (2Fe-2S)-binding protein [Clostridiales bacterium]|nr:(2Fe-2S)-binding protein [Clostridiales bacterium]